MVALPGTEKTVRGYAGANLIVCDEAARIDDALMAALRPMLAAVNGAVMLSTPAGKRGNFIKSWTEGGEDWHRVQSSASTCPGCQGVPRRGMRELGPTMFRQEYELEFISDAEALFNYAIIAAAFTDEVKPLWGKDELLPPTRAVPTRNLPAQGQAWERILRRSPISASLSAST